MKEAPETERARLQAYLDELRAAHAEFDHALRRGKDARERGAGGRDLDREIAALERNLADNRRERERVTALLTPPPGPRAI